MAKPQTRYELAGVIARLEVDSRGTVVAAETATHLARATLYRIFEGDPTVTRRVFRRIERAYGLPYYLFDRVLDGDRAWIAACDVDPQLRQLILDGLADIDEAERSTRRAPGSRRHA